MNLNELYNFERKKIKNKLNNFLKKMNTIVFDIVYQKKTEIESIKLSTESEFQQLKIMLCGKYKIFDVTKLFIYYKNNLLVPSDDTQKLKEIFKSKKVKLEISNTPIKKQKPEKTESFKYNCKCKNGATYICDQCEEFLCDFCLKKKKHITHNQKIIKINDYSGFIKKLVQNMATELDERIMNDEAYKFLKYWNYDKEKEINNVNTKYEFLKKQLEDMKQIEIDYLIYLNEGNNYEVLKKEIVDTISQYSNFTTEEETIEEIIKQKKNIIKLSQDLFNRYNKIKLQLLNYTKNLKDLQTFNQIFQNMVQEKFNFIKKKLNLNNYQNLNININFNDTNESMLKSRFFTLNNDATNNSVKMGDDRINSSMKYMNEEDKNSRGISVKLNSDNNFSPKLLKKKKQFNSSCKLRGVIKIPNILPKNSKRDKNRKLTNVLSSPVLDSSFNNKSLKNKNFYKSLNNSPNANLPTNKGHEHLLFKLKDKLKILIFSYENQNFTEKNYIDKGNFKRELTSEKDIIQLNINNKLYLLSGKKHNKFYCYDYSSNSIYFLNNTIFSHYYGSIVHCPKNKKIYLLGGNSQPNCEVYSNISSQSFSSMTLNHFHSKNNSWKKIPSLHEERQEFAAMYFNDYIYAFFGFSHVKGSNLSSIERINVNKNDKFEIVYINEQITLSSLSCAQYHSEFDHGWEKEGILLLGGFDGEKYVESSLVFTPRKMKIRECDVIIPNITKHFQFLFHQESSFIQLDNNAQFIFDMKNNVHLLTRDSYELLSEVQ